MIQRFVGTLLASALLASCNTTRALPPTPTTASNTIHTKTNCIPIRQAQSLGRTLQDDCVPDPAGNTSWDNFYYAVPVGQSIPGKYLGPVYVGAPWGEFDANCAFLVNGQKLIAAAG